VSFSESLDWKIQMGEFHPLRPWLRRPAVIAAVAVVAGAGLIIPSSVPASAFETDGLMMYFDFSNVASTTTGSSLPDLSGNGRNGTIQGSGPATLSYDALNRALAFPGGPNGTAFVGLAGEFSDFSNGVTIEFEGHFGGTLSNWERVFDFGVPGGLQEAFWVGHMQDSGQLALEVWISNVNQGRCYSAPVGGGSALDASRTFAKWLITVGSNGTQTVCRIYKDGVELPTRIMNAPYNSSTDAIANGSPYPLPSVSDRTHNYLGRSNWTADADFEGSIRYLRIYDRALAPGEVTQNAVTSYVVTFDANGGSGSMTPQSSSTSANLTANGFDYSGFSFAGWNTEEDGSGDSFVNGASYPFTSSTTLYAQWTVAPAGGGIQNSATQAAAVKLSSAQLAQTGPSVPALTLPIAAALLSAGAGAVLARKRFLRRR
jgi:hypothetical protein